MKITNDNRGETIIEVLIAIAVIALTLGTSFALANRSLRLGIESRERGEALQIIESQIESLKYVYAIARENGLEAQFDILYRTNTPFCVRAIETVDPSVHHRPVTSPDCTVNSLGASGQPDSRYRISIQYVADTSPALNNSVHEFSVRWDRFGGAVDEPTRIYYRL